MLLAYLSPVTSDTDFPYKEWAKLAREQGFSFDYPLVGNENPAEYLKALEKTRRLLETADAFIIRGGEFFQYYPQYADANLLHQRVAQGSRLLIQPNVCAALCTGEEKTYPLLEWWNAFLARYELSATTIRLSFEDHLDNVPIKRYRHSFRDPALFAGVDEVVLEDPGAIWY